MPLEHTSHSAIEEYLKCPHRFKLRRIDKVEQTELLAGPAGTAFHSMTEDHDNGAGRLGTYEDYLQGSMENGVPYVKIRNEDYNWWKVNGQLMFEQYRRWRQETAWEIEAVEDEFSVQPEQLQLPVVGFIDRIFRTPRSIIVCDIKTGYRLPKASKQLPLYVAAYRTRHSSGSDGCSGTEAAGQVDRGGGSPASIAVNYYDARRGDSTGLEWPTWGERELVDYVRPVERAIQAGDFVPKPSAANCRYCPVKKHCAFSA